MTDDARATAVASPPRPSTRQSGAVRRTSGIKIKALRVSYSGTEVVKGIDLVLPPGKVTAIIGPSGCGKTTVLRCLNRLSEMTKGCRVEGEILLDGQDILRVDPILLRRKVGMVFQKPNPFPMSIRENVLYGVKATKLKVDHDLVVKYCLMKAALWNEVKDRLSDHASALSLGQQQRLCIARALAVSPRVILMDEPAASLDPGSAARVETSIVAMKGRYTVAIVTHNMQQARRVSDYTAFMYLGELVEFGETGQVFDRPQRAETKAYIAGRFG
ncbi:MAG: phosphate ABC transporter ATP-binding protein [Chloroflexota bacterium]